MINQKNIALTLAFIAASACSTSVQPISTGEQNGTSEVSTISTPLSAEWTKITPGGNTMCSDGSEFFLMTHQGDPEKLLFFLEGGGGCSASQSCDPEGDPTYKMSLTGQPVPHAGIFDLQNPENPFAQHTMVYVPYCTGDVHLGSNDTVYERAGSDEPEFTIHHRGRVNAQSGLDWAFENMSEASDIFVTGESAGAIPTPLIASLLADHYPDAQIASLGDGAGGYRYATPVTTQLTRWGILEHLNTTPGFETITPGTWSFEQLYVTAGQAHPNMALARFDFALDNAQSWFLGTNSQNPTLLENITENNADIQMATPQFRSFIAGSDKHTIVAGPGFYALQSQGKPLKDWVTSLANHEPVESFRCLDCTLASGLAETE